MFWGPPSLNFLLLMSFLLSKANTPPEKYISWILTFKESEPAGTAFLLCVFIFSLSRDHSAADKYLLVSPILKTKQKLLPSWPAATQFPFLVPKQLFLERVTCSYYSLPKLTPVPRPTSLVESKLPCCSPPEGEKGDLVCSLFYCQHWNSIYHMPNSVNICCMNKSCRTIQWVSELYNI